MQVLVKSQSIAIHSFSIWAYACSVLLNALEAKVIGCPFCSNTAPKPLKLVLSLPFASFDHIPSGAVSPNRIVRSFPLTFAVVPPLQPGLAKTVIST